MYISCKILRKESLNDTCCKVYFHAPQIAQDAQPGQFVMLRAWEGYEPYLMRPLSLNEIDKDNGIIALLFKIAGKGTHLLADMSVGDNVWILGPLGKGFRLPDMASRVALVGRGIGIAPLRALAELCIGCGCQVFVYLSANSPENLYEHNYFKKNAAKLYCSTDESVLVTDEFAKDCRIYGFDAVYSCGSMRLAGEIKKLRDIYGFPAYVSMEARMACGVGACKCCACTDYGSSDTERNYAYVCKDGPVFEAERVIP